VEEEAWEDIPEKGSSSDDQQDSQSKPKSRPGTPVASPRKRKLHKPTYTRKPTGKILATPKRNPTARRQIPTDEIIDGAFEGALFTGRYLLDIVNTAIQLMRRPLGLLLFVLLLSVCMSYIAHYLQRSLAPLCFLPFVNRMNMCVVLHPRPMVKVDPWRELIEVQSKTFDQLLDESAGGSALSLEVKKAEMATTDLATMVRHSNLKARDMLASSLKEFVDDARKTGRGLQKMSAKVGGAVDNILAVNTYARRTIEEANTKKHSIFSSLSPWSKKPKEIVAETFTDAMGVLSANLNRLVLEAESNLANLNSLEEHLDTIHDMVTREDMATTAEKDDLLAELWTTLGGNRKEMRNFNDHLKLLKQVGTFRKKALIHVTAALETLRAMSDDMEDLRERVATPELVGPSIPMEVHIESIQNGIERLQEGRDRAKRTEVDTVKQVLEIGSDM